LREGAIETEKERKQKQEREREREREREMLGFILKGEGS
jgi:hypothetical protein